MRKRNIAYKVWISQLFNGKYVKQDMEANYIELEGRRISRVNLIASVVGKFTSEDGNYNTLIIDDGSYQIRLKTWGEDGRLLKNISVGDVINVIGKPREYNGEIYVTPEIVKPIKDLNWETARKLELLKDFGFVKKVEVEIEKTAVEDKNEYTEEKVEDYNTNGARQKILEIINKLSSGSGVNVNEIVRQSGLSEEDVNGLINDLVRDGEIYQSKAGVVDVV